MVYDLYRIGVWLNVDSTYMVGFYPSILRGWGKNKGVPHARTCAAGGRARPGVWRGEAGRRRAGVARFCHSPLIIAGFSSLLYYGECGSALIPWVTISWSPRLAPSPSRCGNESPRSYPSSFERTDTTAPLLDGDLRPVTSHARGCGRAGASGTTDRLRTFLGGVQAIWFLGSDYAIGPLHVIGWRLLPWSAHAIVFFLWCVGVGTANAFLQQLWSTTLNNALICTPWLEVLVRVDPPMPSTWDPPLGISANSLLSSSFGAWESALRTPSCNDCSPLFQAMH
jgi:hypothetical protein